MEFGCNIGAKQSEERSNGKWLIAVADELKVHRPLVEVNAQERCECVNGYHKQNADDTFKLLDQLKSTAAFESNQNTHYRCSAGLL